MSEQEGANAQTPPANAEGEAGQQEKPISYEELVRTNNRLLRESQQWKAKAQAKEREKEEAEKAQMISQNEWKKIAEKTQEENKELKSAQRRDRIRSAVHDLALRAGCLNVEDLLRVGNQNLIEYDDDSGEVAGADIFVDEAKRLKPYLFHQPKPGRSTTINTVTPGGVPEKRVSSAEIAALKSHDPKKMSAWVEAFKAKS